jgi:hypothetical protein
MKIERVMRHPISTHDVFLMICAQEFHERKCADAGALSWDVAIARDGDTAVVRTKRKLPTVGFPSLLRKVVPSGVTSTETITWGAAEADGSRSAQLHVDFHGAPARMAGTIHLAPHDDGAQVLVDAHFTATVPLVGRKVEKLAAPIILSVIDAEEATGKAWVADSV